MSVDEAELKRLRFLVIEGILATDLKMHFDILTTFRTKVSNLDAVSSLDSCPADSALLRVEHVLLLFSSNFCLRYAGEP